MYLLIMLEIVMIYFLLLIKDNNNTLKFPNKKCKNIQLYIDNQKFQPEILSD